MTLGSGDAQKTLSPHERAEKAAQEYWLAFEKTLQDTGHPLPPVGARVVGFHLTPELV